MFWKSLAKCLANVLRTASFLSYDFSLFSWMAKRDLSKAKGFSSFGGSLVVSLPIPISTIPSTAFPIAVS